MASTHVQDVACRNCTFLNPSDTNICTICGISLVNNEVEVPSISEDEGILQVWEGSSEGSKVARGSYTVLKEKDNEVTAWEEQKVSVGSLNIGQVAAWEEQKMPARGRRRESSSSSPSDNAELPYLPPLDRQFAVRMRKHQIPNLDQNAAPFQTLPLVVEDKQVEAIGREKQPVLAISNRNDGRVVPRVEQNLAARGQGQDRRRESSGSSSDSSRSETPPIHPHFLGRTTWYPTPDHLFNMALIPPARYYPQYQNPYHPYDMASWLTLPLPPPSLPDYPSTVMPNLTSKKRKRPPSPVAPPKPPPMRAGSTRSALSFRNTLDVVRPDLLALQRTELLIAALHVDHPTAERWRVGYERKQSSPPTLWTMVVTCAAELRKTPSRENTEQQIVPSFLLPEEWELWLRYLEAFFEKQAFQDRLDDIQPVVNDDENVLGDCLDCPVCCERYLFEHFVFCEGDDVHPLCQRCLQRYCTETIQAGSVSQIPCAVPSCKALFATKTVQDNVSKWDQLRMADREEDRNKKVALAAKAVLNCSCGAVGIVREEDVGNGCIVCPGCDVSYCVKCGNEWHEGKVCPPPTETVEWLSKNTKACPNCHTPIEKNGGCDHMHCSPPEGCGHHFRWFEAVAPEHSSS